MSWEAAAILGSGIANAFGSESAAEKNAKEQRRFARNGITWKVKDAKRAGVHPLFALGAQTASFTPSYQSPDYSFIGQAAGAAADRKTAEKQMQLNERLLDSQIKKMDAEARYWDAAAQGAGAAAGGKKLSNDTGTLHSMNQAQQTPALSIGGNIIHTDPGFSDAQSYEDRWGEIGGIILGAINMGADAWETFKKSEYYPKLERMAADLDTSARELFDYFVNEGENGSSPRYNSGNRRYKQRKKL